MLLQVRIFLTLSFESDNGNGWDKEEHTKLNVKEAGATSATAKFPKIYKVDVNNYSLNTLNAKFIVAPKLIQFGSRMIGLKMPILRSFMKSSFSSVSRISARYSSICRP